MEGAVLNIAIVGCGAVAEQYHAPAILASGVATLTAAVDTSLDRARSVARRAGAPSARVATRVGEVIDTCDAVLVALPNHLHADVAAELLDARRSVLVEKPMATTRAACDRMIEAALRSDQVLSAGMVRRFMPGYRFVRDAIAAGVFGAVRRVHVREGVVYNWPATSSFFVRHSEAGGGVLVDFGSHVLDALTWWLGPLSLVAYEDDACGGVEAECRVALQSASGADVVVELSRLRRLPCTARIELDRASVLLHSYSGAIELRLTGSAPTVAGTVVDAGGNAVSSPFTQQIQAFAADVTGRGGVTNTARVARELAVVFEQCARIKQPLTGPASPWCRAEALA